MPSTDIYLKAGACPAHLALGDQSLKTLTRGELFSIFSAAETVLLGNSLLLLCENEIYSVEAFAEKPDKETAEEYLKTGQYYWNSGMFVWKAKTILANLEKFLSDATEPLQKIKADWAGPAQTQSLNEWFLQLPKISIDYAVMEKAQNVRAIKLNCRWLDMGSFAALADIITSDENNNIVVAGVSQLLDCHNSIVITEQKNHLIAAIGLENIVIAHTDDATLVCNVDQAQRLKELLELIKENTGEKFL